VTGEEIRKYLAAIALSIGACMNFPPASPVHLFWMILRTSAFIVLGVVLLP
jgi:hypothetical protein